MKKRLLSICAALCFCMILSACGTPKVKNEKEIGEDLVEGGYFPGNQTYVISNLEITKRRTDADNFSDIVYATVAASTDDGTVQYSGEFEIHYALYNDGWELESATSTNETYIPLAGPDFSEEELCSALVMNGYSNCENLNIYDSGVDLENGVAYYSLTCDVPHSYSNEHLDATLLFYFDGFWYSFICNLAMNSYNCDWHIDGRFYNSEFATNVDFDIALNGNSISVTENYYGKYENYFHSYNFFLDISTRQFSVNDFVLECADSYYRKYIEDYGFNATLRGDFDTLSYFDYVFVMPTGACVFVGKDHIGLTGYYHTEDEYNRRLIVDVYELVPTS